MLYSNRLNNITFIINHKQVGIIVIGSKWLIMLRGQKLNPIVNHHLIMINCFVDITMSINKI